VGGGYTFAPIQGPTAQGIDSPRTTVGSKPAPLGAETLVGKRYAFVCEGEFDAMLVLQTLQSMAPEIAGQVGDFTGRAGLAGTLPETPIPSTLPDSDRPRPGGGCGKRGCGPRRRGAPATGPLQTPARFYRVMAGARG
jgi:hypothetical protein